MRIYDEVVDKSGDLLIDLGKTAVIAGFAGLFVEKIISPIISIATIIVGLALICSGLLAFHLKNRRQEETGEKEQASRDEDKNV